MLKILVLATLAGTVLAQSSTATAASGAPMSLANLPQCAQTCLGNATAHEGTCSSIDARCLCEYTTYDDSLACCILAGCDTADQQTALSFNVALCASENVTIPNSLACASGTSSTTGSAKATVQAAISVATTAVATFTGEKLLTGSCTNTQFASTSIGSSGTLEYPWLGCSNQDPGCCPFDIKVGGALSVCPSDYTTTSDACCPSGWSIYSSAFAGETPCVTTPSSPITAPTPAGASASLITSQLFTLKYSLASESSSTFPTGAIAGTAVGAAVGIGLFIAALLLFIRKRRAKAYAERDAATVKSPTADTFPTTFREDPSSPHRTTVSEMPSPTFPSRRSSPPPPLFWSGHEPPTPSSPNPIGGAELPADMPIPVEMPASTYMDEHHPAHNLSPDEDEKFPPDYETSNPTSSPLRKMETASEHSGDHEKAEEEEEEGEEEEEEGESPIYSPIGGSALLPDSPHLQGVNFKDGQQEPPDRGSDSEKGPGGMGWI